MVVLEFFVFFCEEVFYFWRREEEGLFEGFPPVLANFFNVGEEREEGRSAGFCGVLTVSVGLWRFLTKYLNRLVGFLRICGVSGGFRRFLCVCNGFYVLLRVPEGLPRGCPETCRQGDMFAIQYVK